MPRVKSKPYDLGPIVPSTKPVDGNGDVGYLASIAKASNEEREEMRQRQMKENRAHLQDEDEEEPFEKGEIRISPDPKRRFLDEAGSSDEDSSSSSDSRRPVGSDGEQSPIILADDIPWPRHYEDMPGYTSDIDEDEKEIKVEGASDDEHMSGNDLAGEVVAESIKEEGEDYEDAGKRVVSNGSDKSLHSFKSGSTSDSIEVNSPSKAGATDSHVRQVTSKVTARKMLNFTEGPPVRASRKRTLADGFEDVAPTATSNRSRRTATKKRALSPDEMSPGSFYGSPTRGPKRVKGNITASSVPTKRKRAVSTAGSHASGEQEFVPTATSNRPKRTGAGRKVSNYSISSAASPIDEEEDAVKSPAKTVRPRGRPSKVKKYVSSDEDLDMFPNLTKKADLQPSSRKASRGHGLGGDGAGDEEDVSIRGGSSGPDFSVVPAKRSRHECTASDQSQSPETSPAGIPSPPKLSRAERLEKRARLAPQDDIKKNPRYNGAVVDTPKRKRGSLGGNCRNCRARHRKCEREKPTCAYCIYKGDNCEYS